MRSTKTHRTTSAAVALVTLAALASCSVVDVPESLPGPTTTTTEAPDTPAPQPECGDPRASLRPDGPADTNVPPGSYMAEILERGQLRVGVDVGTLRFSSVDPLTSEFDGFDVDIAREVAAALFGHPDGDDSGVDDRVEFVGIPSSERLAVLTDGELRVDLVADSFTINCARWEEIAFSTEYFTAGQRVLVRVDDDAQSLEDMAGRTICVSAGSTAIANIDERQPDAIIEQVPQRFDCLVRLQQGRVDAAATDDAILAGMAAQDPNLQLIGETFSDEPYGLGLPPGEDEWVRYVNTVLEDLRESGRWRELYDRWLSDVPGLESDPEPPPPAYQD
jgi:polar amino acid transport system substrate-binding protein